MKNRPVGRQHQGDLGAMVALIASGGRARSDNDYQWGGLSEDICQAATFWGRPLACIYMVGKRTGRELAPISLKCLPSKILLNVQIYVQNPLEGFFFKLFVIFEAIELDIQIKGIHLQ